MTKLNTRIAPSPTGIFHIGTARTAYLNYLATKSSGGRFILRIDDTDISRNNDVYTQNIIDTMDWLGLNYDFIFKQSDRLDKYMSVANKLIDAGKAVQRDGAIFLNTDSQIMSWKDSVAGQIMISDDINKNINNLVLIKSDGMPTYHFASVVDDIDFNINLIIRGNDHLSNTIKHIYIYDALNATLPVFAHVGLIHQNGKKISKRDGTGSMKFYQDNNYLPDAVLNALLMLGWGHPDSNIDQKYPLIDKSTAIILFPQGKLRSAPSTLNINKLDWYNKKYQNKYKYVV